MHPFYQRIVGSRVFRNFLSLGAVQAINSAIPLLIAPYVIRQVGIERFGLIALAQAVLTYLIVIADYGFYFSATRDVARLRDDPPALARLVGAVLTTKALLCAACLLLLVAVVWAVPDFRAERRLFLLSFPLLLGQTLLPVWFFHGVERMRTLVLLNLLGKLLFAALILTVRHPDHYVYVNFYQGVAALLPAGWALLLMRRRHGVRFAWAGLPAVAEELRKGWHLFVSAFATVVSVHSNLLILSFFAGNYAVGLFSVAEKMYIVLRALVVMVYQAAYPKSCRLAQTSVAALMLFFRRLILPAVGAYVVGWVGLWFLAHEAVRLFAGQPLPEAAGLLRVLALAPLLTLINIPAGHTLLAYDLKRTYAQLSVMGGLFNVLLSLLVVPFLLARGTVWVAVATEAFVTLLTYLLLHQRHRRYSMVPLFTRLR